jgi:streptogramin lyase
VAGALSNFKTGVLLVALVSLCGLIGLAASAGASDEPGQALPPLVNEADADRFEPTTDQAAAEELPKQDLGRAEAEDLLQEVFGAELEVPAEFFDELEVDAFRSDHVALVESPTAEAPAGLLSSSLPLRTETESGAVAPVDLDLEHDGGHLQPENPLVDVEIPSELANGIALPDAGVSITLSSGSGERMSSEVGDASAFYPNVRPDTDIAITAVPTGVETYTQLRSPDAPRQEVFDLDIPSGSTLSATKAGGAEVVDADGQMVISVPAPWAIDARGEQMPTEMEVDLNSISVTVHPTDDAAYPILLDPIFESYNFNGQSTPGTLGQDWSMASNYPSFGSNWGSYPNYGMTAQAWGGQPTSPGFQAMLNYYVPRYWTDINNGKPKPLSYIRNMKLWNLTYMTPQETGTPAQNRPAYPFMQLSLWDESQNQMVWSQQRFGYEGQWTDGSYVFNMVNPNENTNVKHGGFALATFDSWVPFYRYVNVQQASVEVTDQDLPGWAFMLSPSGWMNQTPKALEYEVSDFGLGIYSLRMVQPQAAGGSKTVTTSNGCLGTASSACPRTTANATRTIAYEPQSMAQGENTLSAYALDPVSNTSAARLIKVKVDHTAPQLGLTGNLTEQAGVGTKLHEYTLNYSAADGDDAAAVAQTPFGVQGTGPGQIERPQGTAVDAQGNVWLTDKNNNRVVEFDKTGQVIRELPTGTADGQINGPRGVAIAPNGNIWVAEAGNKRLQQFTPTGAFVSKITNASFIEPWGVAFGSGGSIWVTDNAAKKVFKYSQTGALEFSESSTGVNSGVPYGIDVDALGNPWIAFQGTDQVVEAGIQNGKLRALFAFGGTGTGNGQFRSPYDIAIAQSGNIFVTDDLNNRVQEFKPDGAFLRQFGTEGSASNQFKEPRAVAVAPGNMLVVADADNHRAARWSHADQDPQSGVAKVEVKVDGAVAQSKTPGCTTKNCAVTGSWTLNANNYSSGPHKVDVIATDAVGLTTTKTLNVETRGDLVAPGVSLSGSMTEQATVGTTRVTYKLKVSATDTGSAAEWKSGVVATTVKVDGNLVDSYNAACATEACAVTREWTMQSSEYAVGSHKVQVTATDGAGRVTTKELSITINKDVTPPKITTGTEAFFTQPQNWLIQKSYGYSTSATDENASGVANFQFKIDGVVVKTAYGTCPAGSCAKTLTGEISVLNYDGGAHAAELVATDIAGNVAKKTWTMNVDPEGHISVGEAEDTLEAVEVTAPESTEFGPVDALVDEVVGEGGSNPRLSQEGADLVSSGTQVDSTISLNPEDGISINTTVLDADEDFREEEIEIVPVADMSSAGSPVITDGSAAVLPNSSQSVDTILRPAYNGLMAFQAIRDAVGPESYSWEVRLGGGESLQQIDQQHAGVFWEDGTQAMLLTAQPAHDADGKGVETTVAVSEGNVVTLTVHHRVQGVTYPVVAGVGYQGGFQVIHADPLPPEEVEYSMETETGKYYSPPPKVFPIESSDPGPAEASASSSCEPDCRYNYKYLQEFGAYQCEKYTGPIPGCSIWEQDLNGFFWYKYHRKAWKSREPTCPNDQSPGVTVNNPSVCAWVGPSWQLYGGGHHITAQALYDVTYAKIATTEEKHLSVYAYGSGYWNDHDTECVCNPLPAN